MAKPSTQAFRTIMAGAVRKLYHREVIERVAFNSFYDRMDHLRHAGFAPNTIVDVGAFHGTWSVNVGHAFPSSRIIMLEAQDAKRPRLEAAVAQLGDRACYDIALLGAEARDSVVFYEAGTGSSVYQELTHHSCTPTLRPMQELASVLDRLSADRVDFIKLDVQGAEIDVLKGGGDHVKGATLIQAELSVTPYNAGAPLAHDVIAYLNELGFALYDMFDLVRVRKTEQISQFDALFINRASDFYVGSGFERSHRSMS